MATFISNHLLPLILSLLLFLNPTFSFPTNTAKLEQWTFIIRVNHHAKPTVFPTHHHWYQSTLHSLSSTSSAFVLHTYDTIFHGFSAQLSNSEAQQLSMADRA